MATVHEILEFQVKFLKEIERLVESETGFEDFNSIEQFQVSAHILLNCKIFVGSITSRYSEKEPAFLLRTHGEGGEGPWGRVDQTRESGGNRAYRICAISCVGNLRTQLRTKKRSQTSY